MQHPPANLSTKLLAFEYCWTKKRWGTKFRSELCKTSYSPTAISVAYNYLLIPSKKHPSSHNGPPKYFLHKNFLPHDKKKSIRRNLTEKKIDANVTTKINKGKD